NRRHPDNRAHRHHGRASLRERGANYRNGENRSDTGDRIAWTNDNRISALNGVDHARSGVTLLGANKAHRLYVKRPMILYKVFLKGNFTLWRGDTRFNALIGHGKNRRLHAEPSTHSPNNLRKLVTFLQKPCSRDMRR